MRFGVPRSTSPSPTRWQPRGRSTYGLRSTYDDSDSDVLDSDSEGSISFSISEGGSTSGSDDEFNPTTSLSKSQRSPEEVRQLEEAVASIRLCTRHHDPYEEWEKRTRKEAFMSARKAQSTNISEFQQLQERRRLAESQRIAAQHEKEVAQVHAQLQQLRLKQQEEEKRLKDEWELRRERLWNRVEHVIRQEEEKVARHLAEEQRKREAEQRKREEEERKRKDEELKKRMAEEKRKAEEERMRKEEEEKKRLEEEKRRKEEEEVKLLEEEERQKKERFEVQRQQRKEAGLTTAEDDWRMARENLKIIKSKMAEVKANKAWKAEWGKWRRQIRPKIGQLTDDDNAINRISRELIEVIRPSTGNHHPNICLAILSSLAKDILLQAEIETTAEKKSAGPLARVTFNILSTVQDFPTIFLAKLVQRVGGWAIPTVIPNRDYDGREWSSRDEKYKAMGYRKSGEDDNLETEAEYVSRVAGIMRVYFSVLKIYPSNGLLNGMFQLPKYWTWFARILGERALLETAPAAQVMYTALDVLGHDALRIWGYQWIKMLALTYEGVTVGIGADKFIGGTTPEGKAARVRVQLEIERIMSTTT